MTAFTPFDPVSALARMRTTVIVQGVLSVLAGPTLGWWVIAALQGIALVTVLVPVVPVALAGAACVVALLLLAGSFTRDVVDLETRA